MDRPEKCKNCGSKIDWYGPDEEGWYDGSCYDCPFDKYVMHYYTNDGRYICDISSYN